MAAVIARCSVLLLRSSSLILRRPVLTTTKVLCSSSEEEPGPRIYTRTGDKGFSSTFGGQRLPKTDILFEALGTNDELSSHIGVAKEFCEESRQEDLVNKLDKIVNEEEKLAKDQEGKIQCILQEVGSNIATPRDTSRERKLKQTEFNEGYVLELEKWINVYHTQLPPLKNFILPVGRAVPSYMWREQCAGEQREVVPLVQSGSVDPAVGRYINRLSDFLFTAARYSAKCEGKTEAIYHRVQPG